MMGTRWSKTELKGHRNEVRSNAKTNGLTNVKPPRSGMTLNYVTFEMIFDKLYFLIIVDHATPAEIQTPSEPQYTAPRGV